MLRPLRTWRRLRERGVMGINRRNADYVLRHNERRLYPLVDDKARTKALALAAGIAVPAQYGLIRTERDVRRIRDIAARHADFVIKPAHGAGGDGILVITDRFEGYYRTASGRLLDQDDVEFHISGILSGLYSLGGQRDEALIEYRVRSIGLFDHISSGGVPDVRIIVYLGYPVLAMLRLPTRESDGKANLHQGAIGVGVDLGNGRTLGGTWHNRGISRHPDTLRPVAGVEVPHWDDCVTIATRCFELTGLGYLGADLVLDETHGPMMLELNARPGLSIQIANRDGLWHRCRAVEARLAERDADAAPEPPAERAAFARERFAVNAPGPDAPGN